ncbi:FAD:protein FMN transferase [Acetivibrio thermocellus]|uniref:FAD:protein FMN transferase n=2 Tax=Acetivibrio thermocellus TaxID=1515 RepID=A3DCW8_ACET2|nr:FAD:protein FMN transferase [Acetivibrio thermocellus]ABN51797.1 ApbE family lipoprotein [Acetivibrio thermocellus ATCC 27405]
MTKRFTVIILSIVLCTSVLFVSCGYNSSDLYETQEFLMGTVVLQKIYHENAAEIAKEVNDRIAEIESTMTINKPGGEINLLNDAAGKEYVKLGEDTLYVLDKAKQYAEISNGAFDVTIGPLVKAWGVFTDNPRVPSKNEIDELLKLVNYKDINIDFENSTAMLAKEGQIVDLGGIAKGFAADEAVEIYKEHGVKSALISLGGNIFTLSGKPDGSPWMVGIRNPRGNDGSYIGIVRVKDKAVVSSGDYERFFEKDGVRYHHILDPKTGYPADTGLIGTTIISDFSIDADALSTAVFVLGLEEGMKLVESLDGVDAVFITADKKIYVTDGLKDTFIFKDESKEFEYVEKR